MGHVSGFARLQLRHRTAPTFARRHPGNSSRNDDAAPRLERVLWNDPATGACAKPVRASTLSGIRRQNPRCARNPLRSDAARTRPQRIASSVSFELADNGKVTLGRIGLCDIRSRQCRFVKSRGKPNKQVKIRKQNTNIRSRSWMDWADIAKIRVNLMNKSIFCSKVVPLLYSAKFRRCAWRNDGYVECPAGRGRQYIRRLIRLRIKRLFQSLGSAGWTVPTPDLM